MNQPISSLPSALTIAGSDSGGGAGIQADLKTFAALGVYGCSVITAVTAQNTLGVQGAQDITPDMVRLQIDAVLQDISIRAVKTGMLSNREVIETVAGRLTAHRVSHYVLDPVMVAKSGDPLLAPGAKDAVKECLFPLALVATPNRFEAEALTAISICNRDDARRAAEKLLEFGADTVVVKGGHFDETAADIVVSRSGRMEIIETELIHTNNIHGAGCTFSAAIAAYLALRYEVFEAIYLAKKYITEGLKHSYPVGKGRGPIHHFWNCRPEQSGK